MLFQIIDHIEKYTIPFRHKGLNNDESSEESVPERKIHENSANLNPQLEPEDISKSLNLTARQRKIEEMKNSRLNSKKVTFY